MSETFNKVRLRGSISVTQTQVTFAYIKGKLWGFILVTQVKFLSTYLNDGLGFIVVTEIQVMAIIIEDTKKSDLSKIILSVFMVVTET
jgi:hypothetical protein